MPATVAREPEQIGGAEQGHLVENELIGKIWRDQIARAVGHQHAQPRVEGESLTQIIDNFGSWPPPPPVPARTDVVIEQLARRVHAPMKPALIKIRHRA